MQEVHIASVIYQILLLTNPNVARVVLISILLNIRKKCSAEQLPSIINHFAFALRNNAVSSVSVTHKSLCKVFIELMKSQVLPFTTLSLSILLSLSDNEVAFLPFYDGRNTGKLSTPSFWASFNKSVRRSRMSGSIRLFPRSPSIPNIKKWASCCTASWTLWRQASSRELIWSSTFTTLFFIGMENVKVWLWDWMHSSGCEGMAPFLCESEHGWSL